MYNFDALHFAQQGCRPPGSLCLHQLLRLIQQKQHGHLAGVHWSYTLHAGPRKTLRASVQHIVAALAAGTHSASYGGRAAPASLFLLFFLRLAAAPGSRQTGCRSAARPFGRSAKAPARPSSSLPLASEAGAPGQQRTGSAETKDGPSLAGGTACSAREGAERSAGRRRAVGRRGLCSGVRVAPLLQAPRELRLQRPRQRQRLQRGTSRSDAPAVRHMIARRAGT